MRISSVRSLCLAAILAAACARSELSTQPSDAAFSERFDFVTDSMSYTLQRGSVGFEGRIRVAYTNRTSETSYIVNCNGATSLVLQKRVGDAWVTAWAPVIPLCLSQPITTAAGAHQSMNVVVFGGFRGSNFFPQFSVADAEIPGTYRIVWRDLLSSYQDKLPFGTPLAEEHRVSNTFTLTIPQ